MKKKRAKKLMDELPKGFLCTVGSDKDCWYRAQCILGQCDDWGESFSQEYCDASILVHDALRSFAECGALDESYIRELRRRGERLGDGDWLAERVKAECDVLRDDMGC